jgi:hypothetical protein
MNALTSKEASGFARRLGKKVLNIGLGMLIGGIVGGLIAGGK